MTSALALQGQHRNANPTLLPRDDHPTPAVHLSIPPPHRNRQQLRCPAHKCTIGICSTSADVVMRHVYGAVLVGMLVVW